MQTFKCHKTVQAAPIVSSDVADNVVTYRAPDGTEQGYRVPASFFARGIPAAGDYLVIYEPDGYASWSPKKKFEDGYALVLDGGVQPDASVTIERIGDHFAAITNADASGMAFGLAVDRSQTPEQSLAGALDFARQHLTSPATA